MHAHMERSLRLHNTPEHKTLYRWAINEIDPQGLVIGRDQIPWIWSLYFIGTSVVVCDTFKIETEFRFDKKEPSKASIADTQTIRMKLRPGCLRDGKEYGYAPSFSMFGTGRVIKDFALNINMTDPGEQEICWAWGCVSYTSEVDFRSETTDDCVEFHLSVKPETFARYSTKIADGKVDEILFNVSSVAGFYSDWSPSISTDSVKVLTGNSEHKLDMPPDFQFEPPSLGEVGGVALHISRRLDLKTIGEEDDEDGDL